MFIFRKQKQRCISGARSCQASIKRACVCIGRSEVDREPDNRSMQPERNITRVEVELWYINPAAGATYTSTAATETADEDQPCSSITSPSLPPPTYAEVVAPFNF